MIIFVLFKTEKENLTVMKLFILLFKQFFNKISIISYTLYPKPLQCLTNVMFVNIFNVLEIQH